MSEESEGSEIRYVNYRQLPKDFFDCIVLGVAHKEFLSLNLATLKKEKAIVYDVKEVLAADDCNEKL